MRAMAKAPAAPGSVFDNFLLLYVHMLLVALAYMLARVIKVEPEDVTKMETMFNLLLGNDDEGRKRHIAEHGKEYLDQLDLQ